MRVCVNFYVDPISPYVWLASKQLARIEAAGVGIAFRPVLFAGLLNAHGQKGPAEIAAKRVYTFTDVMREAARRQLPFRGPPGHPFNPLQSLRMCLAIDNLEERRRFACAVFDACWEAGEDVSDLAVLQRLAAQCGLDSAALTTAAGAPQLKQRLIDDTNAAIAAGVFGVPTFEVDGQLFWGGDRIDALLWHLEGKRIDMAARDAFLARPALAKRPGA